MWTVLTSGLAFACVVALDIARRYFKNTKFWSAYPLPPGPQGLPFIGKVTAINSSAPWLEYAEWAKTYGDIIYIRLFGKDMIIINSEVIAKELLEDRSSNYSDRPYLAAKDLCGRDFSSIFLEYGDRWRLHRRFFHQTFRREVVCRFAPLQHRKVCQLLRRFLDSPDQFPDHIFEYTGSVILGSVYDYHPKSCKDELFDIIQEILEVTVRAMRPDVSILIGTFPALLKLPSWLPGMSFKREMATAKAYTKRYIEQPFEDAIQRLSVGNCAPSMIADALQDVEDKGTRAEAEWMKDLSHAAATGFVAASETSNSVISLFLLLMAVTPGVQKKAQAQIDAIVGNHRLPTIEDRPLLPYIDAILRETLRYYPVVPLAVPHAVVADDVYGGFRIPKGSIIVCNLWSMSRNGSKYPNPDEFTPERFLNEDGTLNSINVEHIAFGFGRRICVGRHFADTSIWAVIAKILTVFTIERAKDENGVEIPIEPRFSSGVTIHPLPFRCSIVPRTPGMNAEQLEQLIEASAT